MIGYGIINSSVHEFCINQIIINFFNRSSLYLFPYYLSLKILIINAKVSAEDLNSLNVVLTTNDLDIEIPLFEGQKKVQPKDLVNDLYKQFLLEEYKFSGIKSIYDIADDQTSLKNNKKNDQELREYSEQTLFKYFCSANIISDKDYNFDSKTIDEIIKDGNKSLEEIFKNQLKNFLNSSNLFKFSDTESKIQNIQDRFLFGKGQIYQYLEKFSVYYSGLYSTDSEEVRPKPIPGATIPEIYKDLKSKLDKVAKAIGGDGTDEDLLAKTLNSMTKQQKCFLCSKQDALWNDGGTGVSAISAIESDLSGDDIPKYIGLLDCKEFGYKTFIGQGKKDPDNKCITHFEKKLPKNVTSETKINFNDFFVNHIKTIFDKYQKNINNEFTENEFAILNFYNQKLFLKQRNIYLDLLDQQINVLEGA